jgi:hypothetical protein
MWVCHQTAGTVGCCSLVHDGHHRQKSLARTGKDGRPRKWIHRQEREKKKRRESSGKPGLSRWGRGVRPKRTRGGRVNQDAGVLAWRDALPMPLTLPTIVMLDAEALAMMAGFPCRGEEAFVVFVCIGRRTNQLSSRMVLFGGRRTRKHQMARKKASSLPVGWCISADVA